MDSQGCTASSGVTIPNRSGMIVGLMVNLILILLRIGVGASGGQTSTSCYNANTGSVQLYGGGGTGSGYRFAVNTTLSRMSLANAFFPSLMAGVTPLNLRMAVWDQALTALM